MINDFFNAELAHKKRPAFATTLPAVNVKENEDEFGLELAAPGLKKEDFEIKIDQGVLSISTQKKEEQAAKKEGYTRKEFSYQSFVRRFTLPEDADEQAISASYEQGVLYITLPKKEEAKPQAARLISVG